MNLYLYTNQAQLRKAFREVHPDLDFKKLPNGDYKTDTRCAFNDWLDHLEKSGMISPQLAERATL